jgi:cystathionine beta-lyase
MEGELAKGGGPERNWRIATKLVLAGRDPFQHEGFVNTPIYRGSTVLSPTVDQFVNRRGRYQYGRRGTPTTDALAHAIMTLEGGAGALLTPSGLAAITTTLLACLGAGDHVLLTDSVYYPTRHFSDTALKRIGVEVDYFDPLIGADIGKLFRRNTKVVFVESPGSLTFEMQDVPAIVDAAHKHGAIVLMDNTWATPVFYRPHEHGVDVSIHAGTKYLGGHADANIGTISATAAVLPRIQELHGSLGTCAAPEDVFLTLRGLRTLEVRLARHMASGHKVARWLQSRPEVLRVMHPALEDDPGHAIWKRDFGGACGLFSFVLRPCPAKAVAEFIEGLELFGIGASWGGFESLAVPFDCSKMRTVSKWNPGGPAVRLHIGLEDVDDLIADLERGLARLKAASS